MDHKAEREQDLVTILDSLHPKKVVVAGPGTGKSYLFQRAIQKKKDSGGKNFLAITFIGKLGDALADDLAGLAETVTLHGFARAIILKNYKGWKYYPKMYSLIKSDLAIQGIADFEIGDAEYAKRTRYYNAVGEDDVVSYAVKLFKKYPDKIPKYDLILIDEFQDFNDVESEFIDLLCTVNEILIVGDDDQALYEFKGSSPKFIRDKHHSSNSVFESHTLRFCSRCTEVVIKAFHNIVEHYNLNKNGSKRIQKEYLFYSPDKKTDSDNNPYILVISDIAPPQIPVRIVTELDDILQTQKIKSVLIIGEGRSCRYLLPKIAEKLLELGYRNVNSIIDTKHIFNTNDVIINGYKLLSDNPNHSLGWRLVIEELLEAEKNQLILTNYSDPEAFVVSLPKKFRDKHLKNAATLKSILNKPPYLRKLIASSSIEKLKESIVIEQKDTNSIFIDQLLDENKFLPRPSVNLDITVCNILGSKGLGADVVFVVGFDQGKIPAKADPEDSEIYQMLVALTRMKKRIYLLNTKDKSMSKFLEAINPEYYKVI